MTRVHKQELDFLDDLTCIYKGSPFTGVSCEYWPSGGLRSEISFTDGLQHGNTVEWYESGQKKSESEYQNNHLHGLSREWYESGVLKSEERYEYAIEIYHKLWNQEGILVESREIEEGSFHDNLLKKWRKTKL